MPAEQEPAIAGADRAAVPKASAARTMRSTAYRAAAGVAATAAPPRRRSCARSTLLHATGDMPRQEVIHELETLTTAWRGDETESGGLRLLAHLYTRTTATAMPSTSCARRCWRTPIPTLTRKIQDEAARTFDSLFLAGKGDSMPPIEALGLFYDFRQLTPIGRRGDEMIRRLADRLVSVDLLDQAAELLQHQVDNRLERRRARAGGDAAGDGLSDEPQTGPARCPPCRRRAHGGSVERTARPTAAARGARHLRQRPP